MGLAQTALWEGTFMLLFKFHSMLCLTCVWASTQDAKA